MDNFRTLVQVKPCKFKIDYESKILAVGSCFAGNIGLKLKNAFFVTEINPFGVLYNPVSILNSLHDLISKRKFAVDDLFEYKSLWHSFSHSSIFSDIHVSDCLNHINNRVVYASEFIRNADFLLITFGTAWVFEDQLSGMVVSNCHKLPSERFRRRQLTVDEIVMKYTTLIEQLHQLNPDLKIVFTVSPIRHWKDGAHENTLSKSILLLAVDAIQKKFENVIYFPAFEIQMDDLRDYRFYAEDMLHPSEQAVDYIWSLFTKAFMNDETLQLKKELEQLSADLAHRPLHPMSEEYDLFLRNIEKRREKIISQYPFLAERLQK